MTLPNNKSRKITVDSKTYKYIVTGSDGCINLAIELQGIKGKRYFAGFEYFHNEVTLELLKEYNYKMGEEVIIIPRIVRKVIEFALKNGWNPLEKGNDGEKLKTFMWK